MEAGGCVRPGRTVPLRLLSYSIYPVSSLFIVVCLWLKRAVRAGNTDSLTVDVFS